MDQVGPKGQLIQHNSDAKKMCGYKSALVGHIPTPILIPLQLNYCPPSTMLQTMFFFHFLTCYTCVVLVNYFSHDATINHRNLL